MSLFKKFIWLHLVSLCILFIQYFLINLKQIWSATTLHVESWNSIYTEAPLRIIIMSTWKLYFVCPTLTFLFVQQVNGTYATNCSG